MITGLDRLGAALRGEPSDRFPVFVNLIDQGAAELGLSPEEYFSRGDLVAEAQVRLRAKYGHDNVWSLFYVGKEAELLGCHKIKYALDGPPNVEDFVIREWDDIARLTVPERVEDHEAFVESARCLHLLRAEAGREAAICAYVTSTMTLPALLMGMDRWMELLFLGPPDLVEALLAKCHDFFVKEVAAYRAGGANVIVYSNPFGSADIVPMSFFRQRSLPWIERDIAAIGTDGVVYYCGMAALNRTIPDVLEKTGIGVYYLSPFDDIAKGREIIAGRGLTCGVINDIALIDWTPEQVDREVARMIAAGRPGGKFLFGTGVMPSSIPEANIRAMVDAAFRHGAHEVPTT
ncbi:MAG: uroporphyrinogen decarboxylase family protein [Candidatus Eisenbacteria bacterium]